MRTIGLIATLSLASCSGGIVPPGAGPGSRAAPMSRAIETANPPARQPTASTPMAPIAAPTPGAGVTTARAAGVIAGPAFASLPISRASAESALGAFRTSCASLINRADLSGLTRGADWKPACDAARTATGDAPAFFARWFDVAQIADGKAFATGYYEPEIAGSRTRVGIYQTPVYAKPRDLIEIDLGQFAADLKGKRIRGKVAGNAFVPYSDRTQIEEGALAGRAVELAYAADPVEFFFLQIQGSGRLRLPDGSVMRIGYDSQNGREYTGIGALMRENKSFVFFRELTGPGPIGAMGLPVVGGASVATDPRFIPLGAPVFLSMDRADANGLWIAQDTGGAIKGANRVDTFWGAGDAARATAGGMSAKGTAFLLLPRGTVARLTAEGSGGGAAAQP